MLRKPCDATMDAVTGSFWFVDNLWKRNKRCRQTLLVFKNVGKCDKHGISELFLIQRQFMEKR